MSGPESEPLTTDIAAPPEITHRRLLRLMVVVIAADVMIGLAFYGIRAALGVLIGGILAFANYYWQRNSLRAIFDLAVKGQHARFLALRYILRYVAIGVVVGLIYLTGIVPVVAVIFGLASFSKAVVIEGFSNIFAGSYKEGS